ncbi:unnamed protein product [Zymoseptoria tritici ST99CH_3D7]|uniref:Zn(2)-C6 fungal-type domain-containing protein n=1 Tax=Zymoseptoria tritici (strain ST99CH_3D7) TaxID=1276538 RepID=A0A1X7RGP4_ZYMT9|nr:unnamed protein product [Zymoseptoria tritici ST99CH_3D7]
MDTVERGLMAGSTDTVIEPDIDQPVMSAECGRPTICVDDSTHVESSDCARVSPQTTGIEIASEKPVNDGDFKTMMQYLDDLGEAPTDTTLGNTQLPRIPPTELAWQDFIFEQPPPDQTHFGGGPPGYDVAPNHSVDSRGLFDITGDTNVVKAVDDGLSSPPHTTAKRKMSSLVQKSDESSEHQAKRARVLSADEESGEDLITTLKFSTKEGKSALGNLASQLLAQEQNSRNSRWRRTRDETTSIDKVALAKSFKNKPIARSCWGCVHLEGAEGVSQCSLLENHGQWPCHACAQDNLHCDLITAPTRKVRCTDCKRQNLLCSYSYTRNYEQACEQCVKDGHRCVAGPAKDGGIIPRIGIMRAEEDAEEDDSRDNIRYVPTLAIPSRKGKTKVAEDCRECAYSGGKCIYPVNLSTGPCRTCKREKLPCTMPNAPAPKIIDSFHPARSQARQPQPAPPASQDRAAAIAQKRRDSVFDSVEVARGTSQITRPISTNYRHPMVFNCSAENCTFCQYPDMQITGIGMKQPEVANIPEYSGFVEISGGYAQAGIPNTRLCSACTMSRSSILYCRCHDMEMMSGINYSDEAQAAATARLLDDDYNDLDKHCNVCFHLATYSCVAVDPEDGDEGCGLKLCEGCMLRLLGEHDKDLGGLVTAMVDQGEQCRSDAELLRSDGALMRYGHWRAQCEVERERERR